MGGTARQPGRMGERPWWQTTTIYQVYPRSFADSDGDGVGDLEGVIGHLDHIADLGIGTVWLSPFFASPQRDLGYDVSDYCAVAPEYGTLEDAERLVAAAHDRGMRVMFDLVLNHTSDLHHWFTESRSSRDNPRADWYIWADGRGREGRRPPNNWRSALELTSAWQWDPGRGQWYLATFLPFQPDLNWRHPAVKAAMFDVVRFWLDRGVDGFRLDIFGQIMKDAALHPNPFRPGMQTGFPRLWQRRHTENTPDNVSLATELRAVCEAYEPERILLGEVFGSADVLRRFLAAGRGLHLVFLFDFLAYRYRASFFRDRVAAYEASFPDPYQPTYVLENHDRSRTVDRVGGHLGKARVLATLLCTLRGVPTIYQGQEIGMANTYLPLRDAVDPIAATAFRWVPEAVARRLPERLNRDEVRTPMQWTGAAGAGFCPPPATPWLPVNANARERNVAAQTGDPHSLLELYRRLLHLRRRLPALHGGALELRDEGGPDVVSFDRHGGGDRVRVVANLGTRTARVNLHDTGPGVPEVLVTTDEASDLGGAAGRALVLAPHSAVVLDLGEEN